ncbi:MAG: isoprenylcysteine carboxylmethyltransferase family protein [Bacteroides sp.]|nr:isoprenylcysteine carboxylmethyltransferase family protein [Bacteroides sp.]
MSVFYVGLAIVLIGQLVRMLTIGMAYIVRGGRNRRIFADGLVTDGLFSHCRNPMYIGNILLVVGMSIISNSLFAVLVMIPLFLFIYQAITLAEENFLRNKFGSGFDDYCSQVNRWWPKLKGISNTFRSNSFDFTKVIFKEYNSSFLWMLGATLLLGYNTYWFNRDFTINEEGKCFIIAIAILLTLYFVVRFLKKRRRDARKTI